MVHGPCPRSHPRRNPSPNSNLSPNPSRTTLTRSPPLARRQQRASREGPPEEVEAGQPNPNPNPNPNPSPNPNPNPNPNPEQMKADGTRYAPWMVRALLALALTP